MIERIRTLSKERGISLSFICKKLGVANVYFIDIEKQNRVIPDGRLEIIADILFTTVDYLKGLSDQKDKISDNFLSTQEQLLVNAFRESDESGKMRIIQVALNEKDRTTR